MTQPIVVQLDRNDDRQRAMLADLTGQVFGFTFDRWYTAGRWDDRYRFYSVIDDNRILAGAGVALMDLLIGSRLVPAIQIGAVASRPESRGQGLVRLVLERILSEYPDRPAFLFAHQGVLQFYPRFGFRPAQQAQPYLALDRPTIPGDSERLGVDSPILRRHLVQRSRQSRIFDVVNGDNINWFHILMGLADDIFYVRDCDAVVIARQMGKRAIVYDVLGGAGSSFEALLAHLPFDGVEMIEFGFTPDAVCAHYETRPFAAADADSYLFVRGFDWPPGAMFPCMSIT